MSEPENTEDLPRLSKKQRKRIEKTAPDGVLGTLVAVANEAADFRMSITLTVGGSVVAGTLVGRTAWYRGLIAANPGVEAMMTVFLKRSEEHDAARDGSDPMDDVHECIHLQDARYWSDTGSIPSSGAVHWRGLLSRVDGWSLGAPSTASDD